VHLARISPRFKEKLVGVELCIDNRDNQSFCFFSGALRDQKIFGGSPALQKRPKSVWLRQPAPLKKKNRLLTVVFR